MNRIKATVAGCSRLINEHGILAVGMTDEYRDTLGVFRASWVGDPDFIKTAAPNDRLEDDGFLSLVGPHAMKVSLVHEKTVFAEFLPFANTFGMGIIHENVYVTPGFGHGFGIFLRMILPTIDDMCYSG